jgi:D-alanyl-D-alanine-carboxypeptidase/D-alanyl-D-alanine-endopeptidase
MMPLAARFLILVLPVVSLAFSCRAESPGAPDGADWIPTFRQDDGHRIMTNDSMLHILHRRIPSFVDPTGQTPDTTPGLVVGIVTDSGREVVSFGTKRIGQNSPPDGDTYFGIASLTKIFTGFVLAKAVCEGTVRLDDSANRYLKKDLKLKDNSITLRQLVTHTSGLPDMPTNIRAFRDLDKDGKSDFEDLNPARNYTREMLADFLRTEAETEFKPGSRFQYSNLGIGLLSVLLQDKLGYASFEDLNRTLITEPLGMESTNTPSRLGNAVQNQAQGYSPKNGGLVAVPQSEMGVLAGSGELVSTANDLVRLLQALTGVKNTKLKPVFDEAVKSLVPVENEAMAYGFRVKHSGDGGVFFAKPGETAGYSAIILWRQNPSLGIVILANSGKCKQINRLAVRLMEVAVGGSPASPIGDGEL